METMTMGRGSGETAARARREELCREARRLFAKQGYPATAIDQVARGGGVSVGSVYNLVGGKEALYAAVAETIGHELVAYLQEEVLPLGDGEHALTKLIHYRLQNRREHHLFLVLFSDECGMGVYPGAEQLPASLPALYQDYLTVLGRFLAGHAAGEPPALHLALGFEGILHALGACPAELSPGEALTERTRHAAAIVARLLNGGGEAAVGHPDTSADERPVYLSRFDYDRLRELLNVAREFSEESEYPYLDRLTRTLDAGRIVDPRVVPPDVITMNSRFRVADVSMGTETACTLVFPADADGLSRISVLAPLGAAVLGTRPGDTVDVHIDDAVRRFTILELLYQPESAGDYHL